MHHFITIFLFRWDSKEVTYKWISRYIESCIDIWDAVNLWYCAIEVEETIIQVVLSNNWLIHQIKLYRAYRCVWKVYTQICIIITSITWWKIEYQYIITVIHRKEHDSFHDIIIIKISDICPGVIIYCSYSFIESIFINPWIVESPMLEISWCIIIWTDPWNVELFHLYRVWACIKPDQDFNVIQWFVSSVSVTNDRNYLNTVGYLLPCLLSSY